MIEGLELLARLLLGLGALQLMGFGCLAWISPAPPNLSRLERHVISFGLGAVVITLWMLLLSLVNFSFHLPVVLGPPLTLATLGLWWARFRLHGSTPASRDATTTQYPKPKTQNLVSHWDWLFLSLLALLLVFAALRAVFYPMWAWDALATWGLKAKVFYAERTLDFSRIKAHNYYPNLIPHLLTYLYLCLGQVNDHLVKLVFPLFGAALLALLYTLLLRLGLKRTASLGVTTFFAFNGVTFIVHLYITYADLALTYFTLGAAGLMYLWLTDRAPRGALPLIAALCAGMAWSKFDGAPLAATSILAAALTLLWLRPARLGRRLLALACPLGGILLGYLPWRMFMQLHHIETGSDHILGFYSRQLFQAIPALLATLVNPKFFGLLWPVAAIAFMCLGKSFFSSPRLFLALFIGGNLLAILLGYAIAPTSAEEFPFYVRGTLDRLLLHIAPVTALLIGEGLTELGRGPGPEAPASNPPNSSSA
jgi:hypothetical protein